MSGDEDYSFRRSQWRSIDDPKQKLKPCEIKSLCIATREACCRCDCSSLTYFVQVQDGGSDSSDHEPDSRCRLPGRCADDQPRPDTEPCLWKHKLYLGHPLRPWTQVSSYSLLEVSSTPSTTRIQSLQCSNPLSRIPSL